MFLLYLRNLGVSYLTQERAVIQYVCVEPFYGFGATQEAVRWPGSMKRPLCSPERHATVLFEEKIY